MVGARVCSRRNCGAPGVVMIERKNRQFLLSCKRHVGWLVDNTCQPAYRDYSPEVRVTLLYELNSKEADTAVFEADQRYERKSPRPRKPTIELTEEEKRDIFGDTLDL